MMATTSQAVAIILVMTAVTVAIRALPFLLFDRGNAPPQVILYLGRVLPPAVIAMLVVYCLRTTSVATLDGWLPAALASGLVVILHLWKGNSLLSIFGGTALYMMLVQVVFA